MTDVALGISIAKPYRPFDLRGLSWRGSQRVARIAAGLVFPALLLIVWSITTHLGWVPQQILPPPTTVLSAFWELSATGDLQMHTLISLERVLFGFGIGAAVGLSLGVLMGLSERGRRIVDPLFIAIAQVPPIGWIPVLMLLLGIGEGLKIVIITKAAMIPMAVNTYAGIRNVPATLREVGEVLTFGRGMQLRYVVLPAALPSIFSGIRYGFANAWLALVAVELLASSEGLGYLMVWGRQLFAMEFVLLAMVIVGLIGFALDAGLAAIEGRLLRWKRVAR